MQHFVAAFAFAMAASSNLGPVGPAGVPAGPGLAPGGDHQQARQAAPVGPGHAPAVFHNKPYPPGRIHSTLPLLEALTKWPPPAPSAKSLPLNLRFFTRGALLAFGPPAWHLALPAFLPPHPSQVPFPWWLMASKSYWEYWEGFNIGCNLFWVQFDAIAQLRGYAAACAWSNSLAAAWNLSNSNKASSPGQATTQATAATCHSSKRVSAEDPFRFQ